MANWYKPHYKIIYRLQDKTFVSRLGRYRFFSDRRVIRFLRWKKGGVGRHLRGFAAMKWYKQRFFFGLKFFNFSTRKRRKVRYFHHNSLYKVGLDRKKGFLSFFRKFDDSKVRKWFKEYYNNSKSFKILNFLRVFESRLDVICFRLKLMPTIFLANSYIKSRGLLVNQSKIFTPSYMLQLGDMLSFGEASLWRFFSNKFLEKLWKRWHRFVDLNLTRKKTKYLFYRELLNKNATIKNTLTQNNINKYSHLFDGNWWFKTQQESSLVVNSNQISLKNQSKANIFLFNILYLKTLKSKKWDNYLKLLKSLDHLSLSLKKNKVLFYYLILFLKKKSTLNLKFYKIFYFYKKLYKIKLGINFTIKKFLVLQKNLSLVKSSPMSNDKRLLENKWKYNKSKINYSKKSLNYFSHLSNLKRNNFVINLTSFLNFMKNFKTFIEVLFLNFFFKRNSYRFLFFKIWHKIGQFYSNYSTFFNSLLNLLKLTFSLKGLLDDTKNTLKKPKYLLFKYFDLRFKFFNKSQQFFSMFNKELQPFIKLLKNFLLPFSYQRSFQLLENSNYLYNTYYENFEKNFKSEKFFRLIEQHQIKNQKSFIIFFYDYLSTYFFNNYSFKILQNNLKRKEILNLLGSFFDSYNVGNITSRALKKVCWQIQVFAYNYSLTLMKDNLNIESLVLSQTNLKKNNNDTINLSMLKSSINQLKLNEYHIPFNLSNIPVSKISSEGLKYNLKINQKLYKFLINKSLINLQKKKLSKISFKLTSKKLFRYSNKRALSKLSKFLNKKLIYFWPKLRHIKYSLLSKWTVSLPLNVLQKGFIKNNYINKKRVFTHNYRLKLKSLKPRQFYKKFSSYKRNVFIKQKKILLYTKKNKLFNNNIISWNTNKIQFFNKKMYFIGKKFNWKLKKQQKFYNRVFGSFNLNQKKLNKRTSHYNSFFQRSQYLRWKLFGSNYKLAFLKKKYKFFYWGNLPTEYFYHNTRIFSSYWFARRYNRLIPLLLRRISKNKKAKFNTPKNKRNKLWSKFKLSTKKKPANLKLFLKSSLRNPPEIFLFNKFQFSIKKRRRIIKRYRFKFGFKRLKKTPIRRKKLKKLSSYRKYNKYNEKYLINYLRKKYFLSYNLDEFHIFKSIHHKVQFYTKYNKLRDKLRTFYNSTKYSLLFNQVVLYQNLIENSNINLKKLKLVNYNKELQETNNLVKFRNKDLYRLLLKNKFLNPIKYSVKSRRRTKRWWEQSKNKKIIFNSNISKQKGLFYGLFLKRNKLKRYKKFFWYRQRWNWNSILTKSYQWRTKLLNINKIRKERKIKFTNIRVKPVLLLPSSIEFDFVSFRALMISFPNLEASITGGSSTSYFYSLVNFYQRLGL